MNKDFLKFITKKYDIFILCIIFGAFAFACSLEIFKKVDQIDELFLFLIPLTIAVFIFALCVRSFIFIEYKEEKEKELFDSLPENKIEKIRKEQEEIQSEIDQMIEERNRLDEEITRLKSEKIKKGEDASALKNFGFISN